MGLNNNTGAGVATCQVAHPGGSAVGVREEWITSETGLVLLGGCQVAWPLLQASSWGWGSFLGSWRRMRSHRKTDWWWAMPEMAIPSPAPLLGHISKTGSGPLAGARDCEIMAEQSDFKKSKDQLGSFIAFLPPRHEVSWTARDRERSSCN